MSIRFSRLAPLAAILSFGLAAFSAQADTQYPLSLDTKFGTTVIPAQPQRVASVDYAGGDNLLALGFQPLTVRAWFGEYDNTYWPWAQPLVTAEPQVLSGELNFEQIAATEPDVIIAIRSGITDQEYDQLSKIAPVVAVPPGEGDYSLTWDERARLVGRVLNKSDEVETRIAQVRAKLDAAASEHPEWQGQTFAMGTYWNNSVGIYSADDTSVALISAMGLTVSPEVEAMTEPGQFYITLSEEELPRIDADLLFWYTSPESRAQIEKLPLRPQLRAHQEGREIFLPDTSERNGALSYGTLLSLSRAVDLLVPLIEVAIDGDPNTLVPEAE
ncbi:iron-siderophore ABC transporter substrate-binding protein [Saccharospirillum mangrovi]|uniref:iron-siderophore ABC transporter substrate-binding protein n=1 Tax=Saccharospirillum mangrovi TaxID=2161747 RepID=UPI000D3A79EB|nr:iron-siderophore ABC transporter substrate-binding protein [Saccharospirillum mangrovi]